MMMFTSLIDDEGVFHDGHFVPRLLILTIHAWPAGGPEAWGGDLKLEMTTPPSVC